MGFGFWVFGLGVWLRVFLRVLGIGFRVVGLGFLFRVLGAGFWVLGLGFWFRVLGVRFSVLRFRALGFRVLDVGSSILLRVMDRVRVRVRVLG